MRRLIRCLSTKLPARHHQCCMHRTTLVQTRNQHLRFCMQVQLPLQDSEVDARGYDDERGEVGGFGSAHGKVGARDQ